MDVPPQVRELVITLEKSLDDINHALMCSLCRSTCQDAVFLSDCSYPHPFCRPCIRQAIQHKAKCPLCQTQIIRRSITEAHGIGDLVTTYKKCLKHFGLAPTVYDENVVHMTQLPPSTDSSPDVEDMYDDLQVARVFEYVHKNDANVVVQKQHELVAKVNERAFLEASAQRGGAGRRQQLTTLPEKKEEEEEVDDRKPAASRTVTFRQPSQEDEEEEETVEGETESFYSATQGSSLLEEAVNLNVPPSVAVEPSTVDVHATLVASNMRPADSVKESSLGQEINEDVLMEEGQGGDDEQQAAHPSVTADEHAPSRNDKHDVLDRPMSDENDSSARQEESPCSGEALEETTTDDSVAQVAPLDAMGHAAATVGEVRRMSESSTSPRDTSGVSLAVDGTHLTGNASHRTPRDLAEEGTSERPSGNPAQNFVTPAVRFERNQALFASSRRNILAQQSSAESDNDDEMEPTNEQEADDEGRVAFEVEQTVSDEPVNTVTPATAVPVFAVGTIVNVQPRTTPGLNKPGGVARITRVHHLEIGSVAYDVKYILGGGEKRVDAIFVSLQEDETERRAAKEIPKSLLEQLAKEGFDTTGKQAGRKGKENASNKRRSMSTSSSKRTSRKKRSHPEAVGDDEDDKKPRARPKQTEEDSSTTEARALPFYMARVEAAMQKSVVNVITSKLSEDDLKTLKSLCKQSKRWNVKLVLSETFHPKKTTLCVLPADQRDKSIASNRTLKAMRCALHGTPMVSPLWITRCRQAGSIVLPDDSMIIRSLPLSASPSQPQNGVEMIAASLQNDTSFQVLRGVEVYILGSFSQQQKSNLSLLLREAGASLIVSPTSAISHLKSGNQVVLLCDSDAKISTALDGTIREHANSVKVLNSRWLFDSISCGRPLEANEYEPEDRHAKELWAICSK